MSTEAKFPYASTFFLEINMSEQKCKTFHMFKKTIVLCEKMKSYRYGTFRGTGLKILARILLIFEETFTFWFLEPY